MDQIYNVFLLLGGIGLFLFGINYMSASLESAAGDNLRKWLEKLTKTPLMAILIGIIVTATIQSSGAVMVMTAGFVSAQLMNIYQALYVMLGAAIGTTITAQIIAFDIAPFAPLILFIGMVMYLFIKNRSVRKIGAIILGFGMLFMGIYLMSLAVDQMSLGHLVESFLRNVSNPFLQFLFGFIFTFAIQSSSASIGILQVIVASSAGISFTLREVVFMVIGMNIGSLAPLVLYSIGGNRASRRTTLAQVTSRLLAAVTFIALILIFPALLSHVEALSPDDPSRQIANLHLLFNIVGALVASPLLRPVASFYLKKMPDSQDSEYESRKLIYVSVSAEDRNVSGLLLKQVHKEIIRFGTIAIKNLRLAINAFFSHDIGALDDIFEREETLDYLDGELNSYITSLYNRRLTRNDVREISAMLSVVSNFERIGDLAENIAEYERDLTAYKVRMSESGTEDLRVLSDKVMEMMELTMLSYANADRGSFESIEKLEAEIDDLQKALVDRHVDRLSEGICEPRGGIIYTDMVSDLERCGDHAMNIAEAIPGTGASSDN